MFNLQFPIEIVLHVLRSRTSNNINLLKEKEVKNIYNLQRHLFESETVIDKLVNV